MLTHVVILNRRIIGVGLLPLVMVVWGGGSGTAFMNIGGKKHSACLGSGLVVTTASHNVESID
tara:strand:+ start:296 stop:484 length:189 start_codon:yes stop_codon:yes gene_type:complete